MFREVQKEIDESLHLIRAAISRAEYLLELIDDDQQIDIIPRDVGGGVDDTEGAEEAHEVGQTPSLPKRIRDLCLVRHTGTLLLKQAAEFGGEIRNRGFFRTKDHRCPIRRGIPDAAGQQFGQDARSDQRGFSATGPSNDRHEMVGRQPLDDLTNLVVPPEEKALMLDVERHQAGVRVEGQHRPAGLSGFHDLFPRTRLPLLICFRIVTVECGIELPN